MMLLAGGVNPDRLGAVANRYTAWMQQYYNAMAECSAKIFYCHDDIVWATGAVFHPDWYRNYIFPNYKKLFAPLLEAGKKILYVCDGNYTDFVQDIADCGVHGFFLEPCMDLQMMVERFGSTHFLIGNVDTHKLLYGSKEEIKTEVQRCITIGKKCPGYLMAVSNMIPANTPVENAIYYNQTYEELCKR